MESDEFQLKFDYFSASDQISWNVNRTFTCPGIKYKHDSIKHDMIQSKIFVCKLE